LSNTCTDTHSTKGKKKFEQETQKTLHQATHKTLKHELEKKIKELNDNILFFECYFILCFIFFLFFFHFSISCGLISNNKMLLLSNTPTNTMPGAEKETRKTLTYHQMENKTKKRHVVVEQDKYTFSSVLLQKSPTFRKNIPIF